MEIKHSRDTVHSKSTTDPRWSWTPQWGNCNPFFWVITSSRHSAAHETTEIIQLYLRLYYCSICCQTKWCVCSCDSSAMVRRHSRRPTVPTRTRWARQRVCVNTHSLYFPLLIYCPSSLSEPLKSQPVFAEFPPGHHGNHSVCTAPPSLARNDGC